jgi:hypothetical protein
MAADENPPQYTPAAYRGKSDSASWSAAQWAALAAAFSAIAAMTNAGITLYRAPEKQALYQERWRAYNAFARATVGFSVALADGSAGISNNVDNEVGLAKMSQSDLLAASRFASDMLRARRALTEDVSSILGPWPRPVVKQILAADQAAEAAIQCPKLLGVHSDDMRQRADWWNYVRSQAAQDCKGFHQATAASHFDAAARMALKSMDDSRRRGDPEE